MKKTDVFLIVLTIIVIVVMALSVIKISMKPKIEITKENLNNLILSYSTGTMIDSSVIYTVTNRNEKFIATIKPDGIPNKNKVTVELNEEQINKIIDILNKYDVISWDGFYKVDKDVLDGNSFSFSLGLKNKSKVVYAHGYMQYPGNYGNVEKELDSIFNELYNNKKINSEKENDEKI